MKKLYHLSLKHEIGLNDFQDFVINNVEPDNAPIPVIMQKAKEKTLLQSVVLKLK